MMDTPVAIIIFNRPNETRRLIDLLRKVQPSRLFVIADGPRTPEEAGACQAVRDIIKLIDWPCYIEQNLANINLGLKRRIESGITWVFERVEKAIILEEDCVPDQTFFQYCKVLLDNYENDTRIMSISGNNFQFMNNETEYSYYFSRYMHCWGWATWRRAWKLYDSDMTLWPKLRAYDWLSDFLGDPAEARYWLHTFNSVYENRTNSWAYRWLYSSWTNHGLTILPKRNLVANTGFGDAATNTTVNSIFNNVATVPMEFPLSHPPCMLRHVAADNFYARRLLPLIGMPF